MVPFSFHVHFKLLFSNPTEQDSNLQKALVLFPQELFVKLPFQMICIYSH